jgi:hypothetical protein
MLSGAEFELVAGIAQVAETVHFAQTKLCVGEGSYAKEYATLILHLI